jgi:hypothetical protein
MRSIMIVLASLVPAAALAVPAPKPVICHATRSAGHPYNRIAVGQAAMGKHLALHAGDFAWDPSTHDEHCQAAVASDCGASPETAALSCRAILDDCGPRPDGVYWVDPSAGGAPFEVSCDMTQYGGGWMLVGKLGQDAHPTSDFRSDLDVPSLSPASTRTGTSRASTRTAASGPCGSTPTPRTT